MPTKLVDVKLPNGESLDVEIEVADLQSGAASITRPEGLDFEDALSKIKTAAGELVSAIRDMAERPDSFEIQFGVKFNASAGVVIAKASTEANFTIKLGWSAPKGAAGRA